MVIQAAYITKITLLNFKVSTMNYVSTAPSSSVRMAATLVLIRMLSIYKYQYRTVSRGLGVTHTYSHAVNAKNEIKCFQCPIVMKLQFT